MTVKVCVYRTEKYRENYRKVFSLIHIQCANYIRAYIKALYFWSIIKADLDILSDLHVIKKLIHKHYEIKHLDIAS